MFKKASNTGNGTIVIIGPGDEANLVAKKFSYNSGECYEITVIDVNHSSFIIKELVTTYDTICITSKVSKDKTNELLALCQEANKDLYLLPGLYEVLLQGSNLVQIDDMPLIAVNNLGLSRRQKIMKRILDLFLAVPFLVIAFFLFPLIYLTIKLTSPGPVFYIQKRVGLNGKLYKLFKFRSMIHRAEQLTGPVLASEDDARITKIGKILRATRLDEIPQLINVFRGDMSIVGPRPERPGFASEYLQKIPGYNYRHRVKPGITGLAQVRGKYATSVEDKLRYDLWYIKNYSVCLDLKMLLQTLPVVLNGNRARGIANHKLGAPKSEQEQ